LGIWGDHRIGLLTTPLTSSTNGSGRNGQQVDDDSASDGRNADRS
jgi:hypothetical protein